MDIELTNAQKTAMKLIAKNGYAVVYGTTKQHRDSYHEWATISKSVAHSLRKMGLINHFLYNVHLTEKGKETVDKLGFNVKE